MTEQEEKIKELEERIKFLEDVVRQLAKDTYWPWLLREPFPTK